MVQDPDSNLFKRDSHLELGNRVSRMQHFELVDFGNCTLRLIFLALKLLNSLVEELLNVLASRLGQIGVKSQIVAILRRLLDLESLRNLLSIVLHQIGVAAVPEAKQVKQMAKRLEHPLMGIQVDHVG